jgi:protease-4
MFSRVRRAWRFAVDSYVVFVVLGVVLGAVLAPVAVGLASAPGGTVAVVYVDGSITGAQATSYSAQMEAARAEADAVVVVANSGGGSAPASEEMYMETVRTAEQMPVVAAVDAAAASGAYYAIAPAESIYVKPSSTVGSVGVVAQAPPQIEPNEQIATTGPNKLSGGDGREFLHGLATIQSAFLGAVYEHRADRLALERDELAEAATYTGLAAVENGLADSVGDRERAVDAAAAAADIEDPTVEVMRPSNARSTFLTQSAYLASDAPSRELTGVDVYREEGAGLPTYLMVPAGVLGTETPVVDGSTAVTAVNATGETGTGTAEATASSVRNDTRSSTERLSPPGLAHSAGPGHPAPVTHEAVTALGGDR